MRTLNQFAETTSGVVYIHSSPAALCPHVEWALAGVLDSAPGLAWHAQPAAPGSLRAETNWVGPVGSGGRLASALREWPLLRFEVTEDPSEGLDGERFSHAPGLGLWRGNTSANGDIVLGEQRLRAMIARNSQSLAADLDAALGAAWDEELEEFRGGGYGAEITWLGRHVG